MIGGGVPKNFAQDTVICAECLGKMVPMHKYAVQITVADVRDGACSSSTLKAGSVLPLIISYVYHKADWKKRVKREWNRIFE
jgi:deoxyhypusine synthase